MDGGRAQLRAVLGLMTELFAIGQGGMTDFETNVCYSRRSCRDFFAIRHHMDVNGFQVLPIRTCLRAKRHCTLGGTVAILADRASERSKVQTEKHIS